MGIENPKTLRELVAMIEQDNPRYLDVPLHFRIEGEGKTWGITYLTSKKGK